MIPIPTPEFQGSVSLVRSSIESLCQRQPGRRLPGPSSSIAWLIVRMRQMEVPIDNKGSDRQIITHRILRIAAKHLVWRVICDPRPRIVGIVYCIERFVADQTVEQTSGDQQSFAERSQIRHVRQTDMAKHISSIESRFIHQKCELFCIPATLEAELHAPR